MLKALGEDCAGAFEIFPDTDMIKRNEPRYFPITLGEIVKTYTEQPIFYLGIKNENIRLSLAGAQDKVPILYEKNRIFLPENGAPSSHILKFPSRDYAYLTENEFLISQLAQDCGLNVMPSILLYQGDFAGLLFERYDRHYEGKKLKRLHQEDFCQALGISHQNKYEEEGGPSFARSIDLIQAESANVIEDIEQLLKWLFFNICIGNCDNHGKNLSLLMTELNRWALSPFYDLLCTKVYPSLSKKQAMSIGGCFDGANLSTKHWQQLLKEVNYSYNKFVKDICLPIVDTIQFALPENVKQFEGKSAYNFMKVIAKEVISFSLRAERSLMY